MPLCYGWLHAPLTASSTKKVLNVPQRARLRAFLVCILVNVALAQPRLEIHFVTRSKKETTLLSSHVVLSENESKKPTCPP